MFILIIIFTALLAISSVFCLIFITLINTVAVDVLVLVLTDVCGCVNS